LGAARDVIDAGRRRAAELLEADVGDIVFDRSRAQFHVTGTPARALTWSEIGPVEAEHRFAPEGGRGTFAFGAWTLPSFSMPNPVASVGRPRSTRLA